MRLRSGDRKTNLQQRTALFGLQRLVLQTVRLKSLRKSSTSTMVVKGIERAPTYKIRYSHAS